MIAKAFNVDIPSGANKAEVKSFIVTRLSEIGLMSDSELNLHDAAAVAGAAAAPADGHVLAVVGAVASPVVDPDVPGEDPHGGLGLAFRLREVELE